MNGLKRRSLGFSIGVMLFLSRSLERVYICFYYPILLYPGLHLL